MIELANYKCFTQNFVTVGKKIFEFNNVTFLISKNVKYQVMNVYLVTVFLLYILFLNKIISFEITNPKHDDRVPLNFFGDLQLFVLRTDTI